MSDPSRPAPSSVQATPWWAAVGFGVLAVAAARYPALGRSSQHRQSASPGEGSTQTGSAATDAGKGRDADTPSELPARGWKDILVRLYQSLDENRVLAVAAGVTFYGLLSLFPAIVALVSLYGLFADASTISDQLKSLGSVLPGGALDIVAEQVKRITSKGGGSLSFGFIAGLAVALWSANSGMKAIFDALNVAYGEREKRGFLGLNALSLVFTLGAIAVLVLALGAVVAIPVVLKTVPLGSTVAGLLAYLRWPILLVLVALGFAVLYRFGPSRRKAQWRWVWWGSAFAAVAWLLGSALFSFYVSHFGSYNATYGSLGAVIGFMTWIWISSVIVMIGAELNAEMEHQTERDTTIGDGKPLGSRGAKMADSVAR